MRLERNDILFAIFQAIVIFLLFVFKGELFWLVLLANLAVIAISLNLLFNFKRTKDQAIYYAVPILLFLSTTFFLTVIKSLALQIGALVFYLILSLGLIKSMQRILKRREEDPIASRNFISMASLIIVFLSLADLINIYIFYQLPKFIFLGLVFAVIFLITVFLFKIYDLFSKKNLIYVFLAAFSTMEIVWAGSFWLVNYSKSKLGEIGVPFLSIATLVFYYSFWGIVHHKMTNTLTKKVLTEYALVSGLILLILFITTNWLPLGVIN